MSIILPHIFKGLAVFFNMAFSIIYFMMIIRIIMSWVNANPYNEIVRAVFKITEPILAPFRRLPLRIGMIDFSPIVVFILITVLQDVVVGIFADLAVYFSR